MLLLGASRVSPLRAVMPASAGYLALLWRSGIWPKHDRPGLSRGEQTFPTPATFHPRAWRSLRMGKQGARMRHRLPTTGDPDLEYVGVRLGEATQAGANQRSPWGPEKEGGPGSVPDPQGWALGRGWGLLSGGSNYNTSSPLWPGGVQGPAKNLGSEKSRF